MRVAGPAFSYPERDQNPWETWSEIIFFQRNETFDFFLFKGNVLFNNNC